MIILASLYIFLVYSLLHANGHDQKSSLTFVIDDTGSMGDDIAQVISKTNEVFDAVLKANSSKIDEFVLVTFNDPGKYDFLCINFSNKLIIFIVLYSFI